MTKSRTKRKAQGSSGAGNDLLKYAGGAQLLGISEKTLQGWVERGTQDVPFIRLGRLIRFSPASLSRWLASREQNADQLATPTNETILEARD
jgi:excisionase family DNA binding protein